MITPPAGTRVWLAGGFTDMRKGFDGLAMLVQEKLRRDPFGGQIFVFRGRRGYLLKALWWDGQGLCLFAKRLETGRFVWPSPADGCVVLTPAQLGMLYRGAAALEYRPYIADPRCSLTLAQVKQLTCGSFPAAVPLKEGECAQFCTIFTQFCTIFTRAEKDRGRGRT